MPGALKKGVPPTARLPGPGPDPGSLDPMQVSDPCFRTGTRGLDLLNPQERADFMERLGTLENGTWRHGPIKRGTTSLRWIGDLISWLVVAFRAHPVPGCDVQASHRHPGPNASVDITVTDPWAA